MKFSGSELKDIAADLATKNNTCKTTNGQTYSFLTKKKWDQDWWTFNNKLVTYNKKNKNSLYGFNVRNIHRSTGYEFGYP